jgi:hypothetical protein
LSKSLGVRPQMLKECWHYKRRARALRYEASRKMQGTLDKTYYVLYMIPTTSGNCAKKSHTQTYIRPKALGTLWTVIWNFISNWHRAHSCTLTNCAAVMRNLRRRPKRDRQISKIRQRPNSKTQMCIQTKLSPMQLDL